MKRWEYKKLTVIYPDAIDMNEHGIKGWEVITINFDPIQRMEIFLKREFINYPLKHNTWITLEELEEMEI